jgi:hypothetical protein
MPHHTFRVSALLLLTQLLLGCVTQPKDRVHSGQIQPFPREWGLVKIDAQASELRWNTPSQTTVNQQEQLRQQLAEALEETLNDGQQVNHLNSSAVTPARYLLTVHSVTINPLWAIIPCFFYFTVLGCPLMSQTANIQLNLQVGERLYETRAQGSALKGFYYNHDPAQGLALAAVTDAVREALITLQRSLRGQRGDR